MDCFAILKTSKIYQVGGATFVFIFLLLSSHQASAESSPPVTAEMVDSYLEQALSTFSDQKIQRYEKGYLETAGIRSKYPLLQDKKEYLKADLSMVYMTPEEKKEYRAAFEKNIQRYRKLTGLNIRMTTQQERNAYFNMVITKTDITAITSYKGYKNYF
ncbi:hypothetical protein [Hydrogenovibrio sp. JE_KL2]|uniref:hypothetical protein n=1 Tax=Hydrogenovibrio sp. JE_KL2 TaxID=2651188 RepID=UPI00128CC261|nr:hypothetical protein [Hydrogenovibrio sp. JE_KL2]MPQ77611.1 hypothetical protein [Hydrogenovibrio sp. JE_KL2]